MADEYDLPVEVMPAANAGVPAVFILLNPPYAMNGDAPQAREMSPAQARRLATEIERAAATAEEVAADMKRRR